MVGNVGNGITPAKGTQNTKLPHQFCHAFAYEHIFNFKCVT